MCVVVKYDFPPHWDCLFPYRFNVINGINIVPWYALQTSYKSRICLEEKEDRKISRKAIQRVLNLQPFV